MKTYRIYFDKHRRDQLVWSVDDGDQRTERHFASVTITGAEVRTCYSGQPANDASPVAWIEATGVLRTYHDDRYRAYIQG